jgi:hypothetical protein
MKTTLTIFLIPYVEYSQNILEKVFNKSFMISLEKFILLF